MSHVKVSFDTPEYTANADGIGTLANSQPAYPRHRTTPPIYRPTRNCTVRQETPQSETTSTRSPYGVAKLWFLDCQKHRESYGLHAQWHLSTTKAPARRNLCHPANHVAVAQIEHGLNGSFTFSNGSQAVTGATPKTAQRQTRLRRHPRRLRVGHWTHSVNSDFVNMAFAEVGRTLEWKGRRRVICTRTGQTLVVDPRYFRPAEVDLLVGDASKASACSAGSPSTP